MCYSGQCEFENYMGDCVVHMSFSKFEEHFGWSPCIFAEVARCPEEEEYIAELRHDLAFRYNQKVVRKYLRQHGGWIPNLL